jgi:MATE family multidrug resistance protein
MDSTPQKPIDLNSQGRVLELLAISLPMMVSQACETIMMFSSRFFLSKLDSAAMNAAMAGGLTCFMFTTFFMGITGYSTALVAQHYGAGQKNRCITAAMQAFIIVIAAYPLILACIPLGHWLFGVMDLDKNQMGPQIAYFNILMYGAIIMLMRNCMACFFSGIGRTRIVMISSAAAMTVNIFANHVLIYGELGFPKMGIEGAAVGTLIGSFTGLIMLVAGLLRPAIRAEFNILKGLHYDRALMGKLLKFGYPSGLEFFLNILAFTLLVLNFQSYGPAVAAAATITFNWDMVSFIPLVGVGIGVTSLVGRYMGAGKPDTAHRAAMSGIKVAVTYTTVTFLTFLIFADPLVSMFEPLKNHETFEEAKPLAVFMVRLISLYVFADAMTIVFGGALRGAGDTFWTMVISVSGHWALAATSFVMIKALDFSPRATWLAVVALVMLIGLMLYLRYRTGKWRMLKVVDD